MRYLRVIWVMVLVLGWAQAQDQKGFYTLNIKNLCTEGMNIYIDGLFVGRVEAQQDHALVLVSAGHHALFAHNPQQYTEAEVVADQDYDWTLCQ